MIINFARRAHDHNWELDPIVRSLLDTDFYKLLMLQFIWRHFPATQATFSVVDRAPEYRLAETINPDELAAQLEYVQQLRFSRSELVWMAGNTFYGRRGIFEPDFLEWLDRGFKLSEYQLNITGGHLSVTFHGSWAQTTLWEIYALSILSELKTRAALKSLSELELDILYARAKARLWDKLERLRGVPDLHISDFGTRRRHSFLWQEYVVTAMRDIIDAGFVGTSNSYLAFRHDLEAVGTNAHELPMALAALANNENEVRSAQYRLLDMWQHTYQGELLILLPDTFGTTQFLRNAPDWVADWSGQRADSKDPFVAGEEYIAWLKERGRDSRQKLFIASDSLDVDEILQLHACFAGQIQDSSTPTEFRSAGDFRNSKKWVPERRIRFAAGWGTLLTNDFRDCDPRGDSAFDPPHLICKLSDVDGRPAVKLSDNLAKAIGDPEEIERYRRVFGMEGIATRSIVT